MIRAVALSVAVAISSGLTAFGQSAPEVFRFDTLGVTYVAVRADAWEDVVARWITNDRVNRARISLVLGLTAEIDAAKAKGETYRKDAEEARANEVAALAKLNVFEDENRNLSRKLRRRTPWATAMKVEVGVILAVGMFVTYQELRP